MQRHLAALAIAFVLGMVLTRAMLMKKQGIKAFHFGQIDKTDYLIPPFAICYFYIVFAAAFHFPSVGRQELFRSGTAAWVGVGFCVAGVVLLFLSLVSFGRSFRVGIDQEHPDRLVTTGVFGFSRNPIYVAFWFVLLGQFLVFSSWILLIYAIFATWLFNRQIAREEDYMRRHYGQEYLDYCDKVRRYL